MAGRYDCASCKRAHNFADADWCRVIGDCTDPAAHCRFDRQIFIAYQKLSLSKLWHRRLDNLEMLGLWNAGWACLEPDLSVEPFRHAYSDPLMLKGRMLLRQLRGRAKDCTSLELLTTEMDRWKFIDVRVGSIAAEQFSPSAALCPLLSNRVLNGAARGTQSCAMYGRRLQNSKLLEYHNRHLLSGVGISAVKQEKIDAGHNGQCGQCGQYPKHCLIMMFPI